MCTALTAAERRDHANAGGRAALTSGLSRSPRRVRDRRRADDRVAVLPRRRGRHRFGTRVVDIHHPHRCSRGCDRAAAHPLRRLATVRCWVRDWRFRGDTCPGRGPFHSSTARLGQRRWRVTWDGLSAGRAASSFSRIPRVGARARVRHSAGCCTVRRTAGSSQAPYQRHTAIAVVSRRSASLIALRHDVIASRIVPTNAECDRPNSRFGSARGRGTTHQSRRTRAYQPY
jgi:hypothetical protein